MRKSAAIACSLIWLTGFISHQASAGSAPDKIKFPYSPISWNSLPWWMAKDAGHFERNGFDVDLFYEGASSAIVQAMLAGEANFAGLAGPSVVSNVHQRWRRDSNCGRGEDVHGSYVFSDRDQRGRHN